MPGLRWLTRLADWQRATENGCAAVPAASRSNPEKAEGLSPELQAALEPLLNTIESLSERIVEYNESIEKLARDSYPQVALLEADQGRGHADRAQVVADAGRSTPLSQEP